MIPVTFEIFIKNIRLIKYIDRKHSNGELYISKFGVNRGTKRGRFENIHPK